MAPRTDHKSQTRGRRLEVGASDQAESVWVRTRTDLLTAASTSEARCNSLQSKLEDMRAAHERMTQKWIDEQNNYLTTKREHCDEQWQILSDRIIGWAEIVLTAMEISAAQPRITLGNIVLREMEEFISRWQDQWSAIYELETELGAVAVVACVLALYLPRRTSPLHSIRETGLTLLAEVESEGHSDNHRRLLFVAIDRLRCADQPDKGAGSRRARHAQQHLWLNDDGESDE